MYIESVVIIFGHVQKAFNLLFAELLILDKETD